MSSIQASRRIFAVKNSLYTHQSPSDNEGYMALPKMRGTFRQKKLAEAIVQNSRSKKPKNKQDLVASVGYSEMSADKKATEIIESKGVQKELEILGFTSENAKKVVSEIMLNPNSEDRDRLTASKMVFEVHGDFAPEKRIQMNVNAEDLAKKIQEDIARFRGNPSV